MYCALMVVLYLQGALLLSEVLREREAQISLKKEKDKRLKYIDNHYIQTMEEVRTYIHIYVRTTV